MNTLDWLQFFELAWKLYTWLGGLCVLLCLLCLVADWLEENDHSQA